MVDYYLSLFITNNRPKQIVDNHTYVYVLPSNTHACDHDIPYMAKQLRRKFLWYKKKHLSLESFAV